MKSNVYNKTNETDSDNGTYGICRAIDASRSSSTVPNR
jgi:hypothetical protein